MGGRRRAKRGSKKGDEVNEKIVNKRILNKGSANSEDTDQDQNVIVNGPTPQAQAADAYDEDAWLGYSYEDIALAAQNLEGSADFVVEVEEGMIMDDQPESCDVGDTRDGNKDDDDFNGGEQHEAMSEGPKTDHEEDNQSNSEDSENEQNHPGNNGESESKNIAIVVDKIRTKAMDCAKREKLNIFAVLLTVYQEQYLVKVSQLDNEYDVLIRAGKIHFRNKPGISTEKILKEDGLYKRCRYSVVAKFQEVRDDFEEGKINLVVVPIMASDQRNNNLSPGFMSRKMFYDRSKLYKNCHILQYTIAKKLISQFVNKRIKIEPMDVADQSKENCAIDPITGEIMEGSGEQGQEVKKPKRAYTRRKDPAALNASKSKPKKGVTVKIEEPEPEELMEAMEEEVAVGLEDVQDPPTLKASKSKSKKGVKKGIKVKIEVPEPEPEPDEAMDTMEAMEEEVAAGLEDINRVENETEVEKPSTSAEGNESNKEASVKPTRKSKRRGRKSGPGRPSKKSKQAQKDGEIEVETALKAELTGLLEFQNAMEKLALENETQDAGLPSEVEEKVAEPTLMEVAVQVEVPELGRQKRIIKKKKIFE